MLDKLEPSTKQQLLQHLYSYLTENRKALFDKILKERTRYITVALENIYQPHNASAVIRSCDCFGIQDLHIIENDNEYKLSNNVAMGASKWVNMLRYNEKENNTSDCINQLKEKGYRIVATTPHKNDIELPNFDLEKGKVALFFGTEMQGLSDEAMSQADEFLRIPMYGFTESYNISVSAALCLYELSSKLRKANIQWQLSEDELLDIKLNWAVSTIKRGEEYVKEFLSK